MNTLTYNFGNDDAHKLTMVYVEGTGQNAFLFGDESGKHAISIGNFFMSTFTVTQALWNYIMGADKNKSPVKEDERPMEHVSWYDVTGTGGFLERINNGDVIAGIKRQLPAGAQPAFRLPSDTEWEYAARGGKHWKDNFIFSGSNNPDEVAWYKDNSNNHTWPVGQKAPNQLGIYDMCGNIWEWCEDSFVRDTALIPKDGNPFLGASKDRVLRGGCHHNGAVHCTVFKRYEITPGAYDGCIGFRLALSF